MIKPLCSFLPYLGRHGPTNGAYSLDKRIMRTNADSWWRRDIGLLTWTRSSLAKSVRYRRAHGLSHREALTSQSRVCSNIARRADPRPRSPMECVSSFRQFEGPRDTVWMHFPNRTFTRREKFHSSYLLTVLSHALARSQVDENGSYSGWPLHMATLTGAGVKVR